MPLPTSFWGKERIPFNVRIRNYLPLTTGCSSNSRCGENYRSGWGGVLTVTNAKLNEEKIQRINSVFIESEMKV